MGEKKLLFLDPDFSILDFPQIEKVLAGDSFLRNNGHVICFNQVLKKLIAARFGDFHVSIDEDFLGLEDHNDVDKFSYELIEKWYRVPALRPLYCYLKYKDFFLPALFHSYMPPLVLPVVRVAALLKAIGQYEPYDEIYLYVKARQTERMILPLATQLEVNIRSMRTMEDSSADPLSASRFSTITKSCLVDLLTGWNLLSSFLKKSMAARNVLIITNRIINPVIKRLDQEPNYQVFVGDIKSYVNGFNRRDVGSRVGFLSTSLGIYGEVLKLQWEKRMKGMFNAFYNAVTEEPELTRLFTFKGIFLGGSLKSAFRNLFFQMAVAPPKIKRLLFLLNAFRIKLILFASRTATDNVILTLLGRYCNIPVLASYHVPYRWFKYEAETSIPGKPDRLLVWGSACREIELKLGTEDDVVGVVGNPAYDFFNEGCTLDHQELRRHMGIQEDQTVVLFAAPGTLKPGPYFSGFPCDVYERSLYAVLGLSEIREGLIVIVKLRPSSHKKTFTKICHRLMQLRGIDSQNVLITDQPGIFELIEVSDVVVSSSFSTAGLDAVICKKPLIIYDPHDLLQHRNFVPYVEYGAALAASNEAELATALETILHCEETLSALERGREAIIRDYVLSIDGQSSQRMVSIIKRTLKGHEPAHDI